MLLCCAGALRLHDAQVNITNSFLGWNLAHRNDGAIFVGTHETDKSLNSTLRLVNTTFDTNLAEATGGEDMVAQPLTCNISAAGSYGRLRMGSTSFAHVQERLAFVASHHRVFAFGL
jgi:hypothetical protein